MKALSIQQPRAWLIANGHKDVENREWTTSYRGLILIHAGKTRDTALLRMLEWQQRNFAMPDHWKTPWALMPENGNLEVGGIVGYATLQKVVTASESPWFESPWFRGRYGFVFTQGHPVDFIPLRGQLGLFDVPAEIEEEINRIRDARALAEDAKEYNGHD